MSDTQDAVAEKENGAAEKAAVAMEAAVGMVKENVYQELKDELAAINPAPGITHWHKSVFESIFSEDIPRYQGITALFFGKSYLNYDIVTRITNATIESLKQKFDVELHTETTFEHQLMGMVDSKEAEKELKSRLAVLYERLGHYEKRWNTKESKNQRSYAFKGVVLPAFEKYVEKSIKLL